jgi:hypothetical protein
MVPEGRAAASGRSAALQETGVEVNEAEVLWVPDRSEGFIEGRVCRYGAGPPLTAGTDRIF